MHRFVLGFAVLLTGCDLYFTDGGDDAPCKETPVLDIAPENLLRNPETGDCQGFGGSPCDGHCGPCVGVDLAMPDWGSCYSACDGKGATECMATPGCFAAYTEYPNQDRAAEFRGCWQTAPSGPVGGSCANLDAHECSRHDNCTAHYTANPNDRRTPPLPTSEFLFCKAEAAPTACAALATEAACQARPDCTPVYIGEDCTCYPGHCGCNVQTYDRCETR